MWYISYILDWPIVNCQVLNILVYQNCISCCFSRGKQDDNLVESLMERMQKYADKLEVLVDDRTAAFMEEKKRTEKLLYEVLPK